VHWPGGHNTIIRPSAQHFFDDSRGKGLFESTAPLALSQHAKARYHCRLKAMETTREKATY